MTEPPKALTPREREIMEWVAKGKTNGEIGQIIGCSAMTVKSLLSRVREKLDVHSKAQAVSVWMAKKAGY